MSLIDRNLARPIGLAFQFVKRRRFIFAFFLLFACGRSEIGLRAEGAVGQQVITFHKPSLFGADFRVSSCIRIIGLEGSDGHFIWETEGIAEAPEWKTCRDLDSFQIGVTPPGYREIVTFDRAHAPNFGVISVSSEDGYAGMRVQLR